MCNVVNNGEALGFQLMPYNDGMKETASAEVQSNEALRAFFPLEGMQGRFVLADQSLLNPDIKPPPGDDLLKRTVSFEDRNYNPFEHTSHRDRESYWEGEVRRGRANKVFSAQYRQWSQSLKEDFGRQENKISLDALDVFFRSIGIEGRELTDEAIEKLYVRYFKRSQNQSVTGVKLFAQDVLIAYSKEGKINYQELRARLPDLTWFAGIFGDPSAEILTQLIDAEAKLQTDPRFIEQLNAVDRMNKLTKKEIEYLKHITGAVSTSKVETPPTGERTKKKEPPTILKYEAQIKEWLTDAKTRNLILHAQTGAGKSTEVPRMFTEACPDQKMLVAEPRIDVTTGVAIYNAKKVGEKVGQRYGYKTGEDTQLSKKTKAEYITYGSLVRILTSQDPKKQLVLDVSCVMLDERHEDSQDMILVNARLKDIQKKREEMAKNNEVIDGIPVTPLKIIITSATIDPEEYKDYMDPAITTIIDVEGRGYKINREFEPPGTPYENDPRKRALRAATKAAERLKKYPGRHILIFMPGAGPIQEAYKELNRLIKDQGIQHVQVTKLLGTLTKEQREAAKHLDPDLTSVIIATPVAESGLTLSYEDEERQVDLDVITAGFVNVPYMDPLTGFSVLETEPATIDRILQQFGRAGRTAEGNAIFLETEEMFNQRASQSNAGLSELRRGDPTSSILFAKKMGYADLSEAPIRAKDMPDPENIRWSMRSLKMLGIVDNDENITSEGDRIMRLPVNAHLAKMIYDAKQKGCGKSAAALAATYSARSLFRDVEETEQTRKESVLSDFKKTYPSSDLLMYLAIWNQFEQSGRDKKWADEHFLNYESLLAVGEKIDELVERAQLPDDTTNDTNVLEKSIYEGYKDRLMKLEGGAYVLMPEGTKFPIHKRIFGRDSIFQGTASPPEFIVLPPDQHIRHSPSKQPFPLNTVQRVKPEWLSS